VEVGPGEVKVIVCVTVLGGNTIVEVTGGAVAVNVCAANIVVTEATV